MLQMLLMGFLAAAVVLWVSVFGYVATLGVLAARRHARRSARPPAGADADLPRIALVIPVRNEEQFIDALSRALVHLYRRTEPATLAPNQPGVLPQHYIPLTPGTAMPRCAANCARGKPGWHGTRAGEAWLPAAPKPPR